MHIRTPAQPHVVTHSFIHSFIRQPHSSTHGTCTRSATRNSTRTLHSRLFSKTYVQCVLPLRSPCFFCAWTDDCDWVDWTLWVVLRLFYRVHSEPFPCLIDAAGLFYSPFGCDVHLLAGLSCFHCTPCCPSWLVRVPSLEIISWGRVCVLPCVGADCSSDPS